MTTDDHTPDAAPQVDPPTGDGSGPSPDPALDDGPLVDPELVAEPLDDDAAAAAGDEAGDRLAQEGDPVEAVPEPDYRDLYLRSAAELDNLRKRARRDVGIAEGRGIGRLARELLPALDNLDRALAAAEAVDGDTEHTLTRGTRLVQAELAAALERVGIKVEIPLGAPFDPHRHEALTQQPRENVAPGLVVEVYQPGYVYADTVLRAAKVVVSA